MEQLSPIATRSSARLPHTSHSPRGPAKQYSVMLIAQPSDRACELTLHLRKHLFRTHHINEGWEGYFLAQAVAPDVVFVDSHLGQMSGLMVSKLLKLTEKTTNIPIIIVASDSAPWNPAIAFAAGASDYLRFDCAVEEVLARVRVQLSIGSRAHPRVCDDHSVGCQSREQALLAAALRLLENDPSSLQTVRALALRIGTNERRLSEICKSKLGMTMHRFMVRQKLAGAGRLLRETRMPIAEIAHYVGFPSPCNFSVAFRHFMGTSPSEYRSQQSTH